MNPFAIVLDALFASPMATDALFTPASGEASAIRVIKGGPDRLAQFGQVQVALGSISFEVRVSDVDRPGAGARFTVGTETFEIAEGVPPIGDVEGLTWTCWTEPVS